MAASDHRKQSLYFPREMLADIEMQAIRLDRSLSWVMQKAWRIARREIELMPTQATVEKEAT